MAIVLRHVHTCPFCEQTWECLCWTCDYEIEEMRCNFCGQEGGNHRPNVDATRADKISLLPPHIFDRLFSRFMAVMMNVR
jgi:hypothetical protein